jgi:multidrug resistance efflux pump
MLTAAVVLVAVAALAFKYWDYATNPWTRNGMVRANVVQITPEVSGKIVKLPIVDNQLVKKGDLLFQIDPRIYAVDLEQARANFERTQDEIKALEKQIKASKAIVKQYEALARQAEIGLAGYRANVEEAKANYSRAEELLSQGHISKQNYDARKAANDIALVGFETAKERIVEVNATKVQVEADLAKAQADLGAPGDQNARLRSARAAMETAQLHLEFTQVKAPVDGYITNLNLRLGDQAVTNSPALALVDVHSFWIHGFFKETVIQNIRPGDRAIVTLMSYPGTPLRGRVESMGRGIAQEDGSTGFQLLPKIRPTFEWIRLAQRVPFRIQLDDVPDNIELIVGTTASVMVMTGTAGEEGEGPATAAPRFLQ